MVLQVSSSLNSTCVENFHCSLDYYASHIPSQNNTIFLLDRGTHFLHTSIMLFEGRQNYQLLEIVVSY